MNLSSTNRDDIVSHSLSIITANEAVADVLEAVQGSIVGLPPSSLTTVEKLLAAISNDPNDFQSVRTFIISKAPAITTYTMSALGSYHALTSDKIITYKMAQDIKPDELEAERLYR